MAAQDGHPPAKRRKFDADLPIREATTQHGRILRGVDRPISPPLTERKNNGISETVPTPSWGFGDVPRAASPSAAADLAASSQPKAERDGMCIESTKYVRAPVQLTRIEDLAPHENVDAVGLRDILGDPMIKECWNFNYLHDINFVMQHFDEDVRDTVKVKFIHGFWKNDDERRISLLEQAERYPNVGLISAYTPDQFGTHHSKMLVLLRHDDTAQVIIHTANMIHRDWSNMTQAVWQSPLLPLLPPTLTSSSNASIHPIGSGERFKVDFMRYLKAYGRRLTTLAALLRDYDFSSIRAAFLGSAPSRQKPAAAKPQTETSFGWLGLQEILSTVPIEAKSEWSSPPHIVIQISSIATLGAQPIWLTCLQTALARSSVQSATSPENTKIFSKGKSASAPPKEKELKPAFNVIFPTPEEIRTSLDGYGSGASIHIKLQSQQQIKQQEYLHPLFCHWRPTSTPDATPDAKSMNTERRGEALRGPAAPHIKTYIRFSDQEHKTIDWAMVTSANLSKQAWGDVVNKKDEIWIQSWEAGVVVWPALFTEPDTEKEVVMVPVFAKDMPGPDDDESGENKNRTVVGFRMPYDLPLHPYAPSEKPWCATAQYLEPDWKGQAWVGYGNH